MKYRRLTIEELEELRDDLVRFLAANHVTAMDWDKLKKTDPAKVDALLDLFSEMVFEDVLKKVEYMEYKTPKDVKTFHCQPDKVLMLGLMIEGESPLDFTQNQSAQDMMSLMQGSGASLKLYSAEKAYQGSREEELFRMLENGCLISREGEMYKLLNSISR
ncbi:MAG: hypothetical protein IPL49_04660 [Saprospirales bacterium]|nr:hypothetical protein [Saprospirales bacterium]MBK8490203.1 hypothetical protein [Saprospirales bacterium]